MSLVVDQSARFETRGAALSLRDDRSKTTLVVGTPESTPLVWNDYICGAQRSYSARGVADALEFDAVRHGQKTHIFCAVVDDDGNVVGGLRVQGPYQRVIESHAVYEWAGQPGQSHLMSAIASRIPGGLAEVKAAYVDAPKETAPHVAGLLARLGLVVMTVTGCQYLMATAADYVLDRWQSGGGRIDTSIPATPYPDERYRTRAMFWNSQTIAEDANPRVWRQMWSEYNELFDNRPIVGAEHSEVA
ncbi:hypothetical protein AAFP30_15840 [Gordonia sp. CPCC 205515]|uniref:hypothetical protein n=1 Tax=Gordonia sp. CPCC 205515 TaxID=3140791 RepID=UPI003AF3AE4D